MSRYTAYHARAQANSKNLGGATPFQAEAFSRLSADAFMAHNLFRAGLPSSCTAGITSAAERADRIRTLILEHDLEKRLLPSQPTGESGVTFGAFYAREYRGEARQEDLL
jgi:hypothetical protein